MMAASHQPLFFPWAGYFDKLARADVFVFSDDVQFNKGNFQHRNRIVCTQTDVGWRWLTVPVRFSSDMPIKDVAVGVLANEAWQSLHLRLLDESYRRARHYHWLMPKLEAFYLEQAGAVKLATVSAASVRLAANLLGIDTPIRWASSLGDRPAERTERLLWLCRATGADSYLAGTGGSREYIRESAFEAAGIALRRQEFEHPLYQQAAKPFMPGLSILDMLFNYGPNSGKFFRGGK